MRCCNSEASPLKIVVHKHMAFLHLRHPLRWPEPGSSSPRRERFDDQ